MNYKKILCLIAALAVAFVATASARGKIEFDGTIKRDVAYVERDGKKISMDIFVPAGKPVGAPAVLMIHGGGFVAGHRELKESLSVALAKKGIVVFNIDYRLSPKYKFPAHIEDVRCAARWVAKHASEYGADPARMGVAGGSAGAYLAAMTMFPPQDAYMSQPCPDGNPTMPQMKAAVLYYGVYDPAKAYDSKFPFIKVMFRLAFAATPKNDPEKYKSYSAMQYVRADLPPILIQVGDKDSLYSESTDLYDSLIKAGAQAEIVVYKNVKHGFVVYKNPVSSPAHEAKTIEFFLKHL